MLHPADVLAANREQAIEYAQSVGSQRVLELLQAAAGELDARLKKLHPKLQGSFTEAKLKLALKQIEQVTREVVYTLTQDTVSLGQDAAEAATGDVLSHFQASEEAYRGIGSPLLLDEAGMMHRARAGARASILRRIIEGPGEGLAEGRGAREGAEEGIFQRYGRKTIEHFEEKLRMGLLTGKSWEDLRGDVTEASPFLQGAPRFWADRIVRTEVMGAYAKGSWETIRAADDEMGDMVKVLVATFDDRTAWDSYAVHGQIRRPDEPFEWYDAKGRLLQYQHPPNRPNDREVVVPHRLSWPLPENMRPLPASAYIERWVAEGHKGAPPPRPRMTTVSREDIEAANAKVQKQQEAPEEVTVQAPPEDAPHLKPQTEADAEFLYTPQPQIRWPLVSHGPEPTKANALGSDAMDEEALGPDAIAIEKALAFLDSLKKDVLTKADLQDALAKKGVATFNTTSDLYNATASIPSILKSDEHDAEFVPLKSIKLSSDDIPYGTPVSGVKKQLNTLANEALWDVPTEVLLAKKGDTYYAIGGTSSLLAQTMSGANVIKSAVYDLDAKKFITLKESKVASKVLTTEEAIEKLNALPKTPMTAFGDLNPKGKDATVADLKKSSFFGYGHFKDVLSDHSPAKAKAYTEIQDTVLESDPHMLPVKEVAFKDLNFTKWPSVEGIVTEIKNPGASKSLIAKYKGELHVVDAEWKVLASHVKGEPIEAYVFDLDADPPKLLGEVKGAPKVSEGKVDKRRAAYGEKGMAKFEDLEKVAHINALRFHDRLDPYKAQTDSVENKRVLAQKAGQPAIDAVYRFTYQYDHGIRALERGVPREKLVKETSEYWVKYGKNVGDATPEDYVDRCARYAKSLEEDVFTKCQPTPGKVFRGIGKLSDYQFAHFMNNDEVTFASTSSTSCSVDTARGFAKLHEIGHSVLFVIDQKSGVAIEAMSNYDTEREVLIKKGTKFRVIKREASVSKSGGSKIAVVHLEEI